jgi:hypothetical protein
MLGSEEMREWTDLQKLLSDVRLTQQEDIISWGLTPSKVFETSSLYRFMTDGGMDSRLAVRIWKCKIPLKIRIFLWQAFQNRIQTAQQLKSMNWRGSERCVLCGQSEDANHLLFECSLEKFVWSFMGETLRWSGFPRSMEDLVLNWLPGGFKVSYQTALTCFAGVAWAIWLTRNKMCMLRVFLNNPIEIIYLCLSFVQKWQVLAGRTTRLLLEGFLEVRLKK